jgi:predicted HTH transcriptional regulator
MLDTTAKREEKSGTKQKAIKKIMALISKNNTISITQLLTEIKISRSTIQKHIKNLKNKGIFRCEGANKGGKWIILKADLMQILFATHLRHDVVSC